MTGVASSTVAENLVKFQKAGLIKAIEGSKRPRYYRHISLKKSPGNHPKGKKKPVEHTIGHVPAIFGIPAGLMTKTKGEKVNESSSRTA